jgi:hypothetical protein
MINLGAPDAYAQSSDAVPINLQSASKFSKVELNLRIALDNLHVCTFVLPLDQLDQLRVLRARTCWQSSSVVSQNVTNG